MNAMNQSKDLKRCQTEVSRFVSVPLSCLSAVSLAVGVNALVVSTAFAYIDPGTGTMILQVAGALFASALFYLRNIRIWIAEKLGFRRAADVVAEPVDPESMPIDHSDSD